VIDLVLRGAINIVGYQWQITASRIGHLQPFGL